MKSSLDLRARRRTRLDLEMLEDRLVPTVFNVNSLALAAARAALDDMAFVARSYAENLNGMRELEEGARGLGLDFIPSYGNFLTIHVGKAGEIFTRLLRRYGIALFDKVLPVVEAPERVVGIDVVGHRAAAFPS